MLFNNANFIKPNHTDASINLLKIFTTKQIMGIIKYLTKNLPGRFPNRMPDEAYLMQTPIKEFHISWKINGTDVLWHNFYISSIKPLDRKEWFRDAKMMIVGALSADIGGLLAQKHIYDNPSRIARKLLNVEEQVISRNELEEILSVRCTNIAFEIIRKIRNPELTRKYVMNNIKNIIANPKKYKENPVWGKLADGILTDKFHSKQKSKMPTDFLHVVEVYLDHCAGTKMYCDWVN